MSFGKLREKKPELDIEQAGRILENIFEANHAAPNSIPLEELVSYSNYRRERFSLQRLIIVIIMVLFFMLPFLFIPAQFTILQDEDAPKINPVYTLRVESPMLVKSIKASIGGRNVPVYEIDNHVYTIEPAANGRMEVIVTLLNDQQTLQYIDVTDVDLDAPVLVSSDSDEENIYLYMSDDVSGVDYEHVEAVDADGQIIKPAYYDEEKELITFPYPEDILNVYIPDFAGNMRQLVISLK